MSKIVIIGSGPAGVSASLYTSRAGIETTIITTGYSSLKKAELIENYYGFEQPITGEQLEKSGLEGAKRLGVEIINKEVVGIGFENSLVVNTEDGNIEADGVLIATGSSRVVPKIEGIEEFEGKGVSYCAVCDAFFYRGKDVVVLGNGKYAVHEANELLPVANSVTILTDGQEMQTEVPSDVKVITDKIKKLLGDDKISGVKFENDSEIATSGFFVAVGVAGSTALAKKIGALVEGNKIIVDENMATNIPGLFAAGDCTGGFLQVSTAVGEGAKAGMQLIKHVRK